MEKNQTAPDAIILQKLLDKYKSAPDLMVDEVSTIDARTRFGDQLIHIASVSGNASDVEDLIALGADVNSFGEGGYTPLHYAAEQGNLSVVEILLSHGADCALIDKSGECALCVAEGLGNDAIVAYMKSHCSRKSIGSDSIDNE